MEHPNAPRVEFTHHLSELYSIFRQTFLMILGLSILWALISDSLMVSWLENLPLGKSSTNLTIYSPFDWIEMKWAISILLSTLTVMPLLSIRLQRFASPGLFPNERTWFNLVLIFCSLLLPVLIILLWWIGFPIFVDVALAADELEGVASRYDAASIFSLAIGISWIVVCVILATISLSLARLLGMVEDGRTKLRNRFLAILGGMLILTLPSEFEGLRILLALVAMAFADRISSSLPTATLGRRNFSISDISIGINPVRLAIVDCGCEGVCPSVPIDSIPNGIASPTCEALCLNPREQEALADLVSQHKITNIVVTGCDSTPFPEQFKSSLNSLDCKFSGLGWLDDPRAQSDEWKTSSLAHSTQLAGNTALD